MRWPFRRRPDAAPAAEPPAPPVPTGPAMAGRRAWELLPPLSTTLGRPVTVVPTGQPKVSGTRSLVHRPPVARSEVPAGRVEGLAESLPALDFNPPASPASPSHPTAGSAATSPAARSAAGDGLVAGPGAAPRRVRIVAAPTGSAPLTVATEEYVGEPREPAEPYRAPAWLRALSGAPVMDPLLGMMPGTPAPAPAPARPAAPPLRPAPVIRARRPRSRVGLGAPLTADEPEPEPARADTAPYALTRELAATYGADLDAVEVRRGAAVDRRARDLQAEAFTEGGIVHLPSAAGTIDSTESRALLAHELIHVAQQRHLAALPDESTPDGAELEAQALAVEAAVRAGAPLPRLDHPDPPPAEPPPAAVPARYEHRQPPVVLRPATPPPMSDLHHPAPPRSTGAPPPGGPGQSRAVSSPPPRTSPSPVAPPSPAPTVHSAMPPAAAQAAATPGAVAPAAVVQAAVAQAAKAAVAQAAVAQAAAAQAAVAQAAAAHVGAVRPHGGTGTAPGAAPGGVGAVPASAVPPKSWMAGSAAARTVAATTVQRRSALAHPRSARSARAGGGSSGHVYHEQAATAPRSWSEFGAVMVDTGAAMVLDSWSLADPRDADRPRADPAGGAGPGAGSGVGSGGGDGAPGHVGGGAGGGGSQQAVQARFEELYAIRLQATNEAREAAGQPLLDSLTVEEQQRIWEQAGGEGSVAAGQANEPIRNWGEFREALTNDLVDGIVSPFGVDTASLLGDDTTTGAGGSATATGGPAATGDGDGAGAAAGTTGDRPLSETTGRPMVDTDELDLDDLALRLYDRIRSRLRLELLLDRERAGLLSDFR